METTGDDDMSLYEFAQGLILEAVIKQDLHDEELRNEVKPK